MKPSSFNAAAARQTVMAVADRGMLGAVTFVTSIMLGRWSGPEEVGLFANFFAVVFLALAVQESFTISPYSLLAASRSDGSERRRYLGGVLMDAGWWSAVVATLWLAAAAIFWTCGRPREATIAIVLACASPCILLREFARRVVYADFRAGAAVAISGGVSLLQLAMLGGLYGAGRLTAATSFAAMGASSLVGAAAWLRADRTT
jgi:O-antigen/teichoic acid export membrane protein